MYSHTPGTLRQHRREVKEEREPENRSERRTRLTRALAPYSPDPAAVGDPEGSPGLGAEEARRAGKLQRASGGGRLPAHPTRSRATSSTIAGRTRGSRRRFAPLLEARTRRSGQGQRRRAGAQERAHRGRRDLPFLLQAPAPALSGPARARMLLPPRPLLFRRQRLLPPPGQTEGIAALKPIPLPTGGRLLRRSDASWAQPRWS